MNKSQYNSFVIIIELDDAVVYPTCLHCRRTMRSSTAYLVLLWNIPHSTFLGTLWIPQEFVTGLPTEPHVWPNIGTIILTRIKLIIEAIHFRGPWKINWISISSLEKASNHSPTNQPTNQPAHRPTKPHSSGRMETETRFTKQNSTVSLVRAHFFVSINVPHQCLISGNWAVVMSGKVEGGGSGMARSSQRVN